MTRKDTTKSPGGGIFRQIYRGVAGFPRALVGVFIGRAGEFLWARTPDDRMLYGEPGAPGFSLPARLVRGRHAVPAVRRAAAGAYLFGGAGRVLPCIACKRAMSGTTNRRPLVSTIASCANACNSRLTVAR